MAKVSFVRGIASRLSSTTPTDGYLYLCTDTHELYAGNGTAWTKILDSNAVAYVAQAYDANKRSIARSNISAAVATVLSNTADLNTIVEPGFYHIGGGNACTNVAGTAGDAFGLIVIHTASGNYYTQLFFSYYGRMYRRCMGYKDNTGWSSWTELQANWNETDPASPAYISNKPQILPAVSAEPSDSNVLSEKCAADGFAYIMLNYLTKSSAEASFVAKDVLTNEDLNDITTVGFYYADNMNTCTNVPLNTSGTQGNYFGLIVEPIGTDMVRQTLCYGLAVIAGTSIGTYARVKSGTTWSAWQTIYYDQTLVTAVDYLTAANRLKPITVNTLAFWDGSYNASTHASNLAYCRLGGFGTAATKNIADFAAAKTRWTVYSGKTGTGGVFVNALRFSHTPSQFNEWEFTIRIIGHHSSNPLDYIVRVHGTDADATSIAVPIARSITVLSVSNVANYKIRFYRISNTVIEAAIYKANDWGHVHCQVDEVFGTTITPITSQTYHAVGEAYIAESRMCSLTDMTVNYADGTSESLSLVTLK